MREVDIMHESGNWWVLRDIKHEAYTVMHAGITHSTPDSSYALDDDGLSIAIARCNWRSNQHQPGPSLADEGEKV